MITVYFQHPIDWKKRAREALASGVQTISINPETPLECLDGVIESVVDAGFDAVFISVETGKKISLDEMRKLRSEMGIDPRGMR